MPATNAAEDGKTRKRRFTPPKDAAPKDAAPDAPEDDEREEPAAPPSKDEEPDFDTWLDSEEW